jgi:hypothetical protein
MFKTKTLFIVGAGASREFGLPTGAELKAQIAHLLDIRYEHGFSQESGDRLITEALKRHLADPVTRRGDGGSPVEAYRGRLVEAEG